jgi:sortase (surface protein transpeptidase)
VSGRHRAPSKRRLRRFGGAATALVALAGLVGPEQPGVAAPALPVGPAWEIQPVAAAVTARPVRLRIPAIGVNSSIVDTGVDAAGTLVPPGSPDVTGWFTGGPAPGAVGPALLAGHVDSHTGPAVFFKLVDLKPGDAVLVERADGTTVSFTVTSTIRVAKTAFPTDLVYAPLPVPVLRLVTCGGTFDHAARSYRDNIIVEAAPT